MLDKILKIEGYCDDNMRKLYKRMVDEAPQVAIFVELGCWKGASTAYLAWCIKQSHKDIWLMAIDTWEGNPEVPESHPVNPKNVDKWKIFDEFQDNLVSVGLFDYVSPMMWDSTDAAILFADETVDFVYIDTDHRYEYVLADINAWLPKVKKGGYIGGHDLSHIDVLKAVREIFGKDYETIGTSWCHKNE